MNAIVLLGWMDRDAAISFLRNDCAFDPQLTEAQAEAMWRPYRDAVDALPERDALAPEFLAMTRTEEAAKRQFLARHRGAANIKDVVKVNPQGLVVHQLLIVLDRASHYEPSVGTMTGWIDQTISAQPRPHQVQLRVGPNIMEVDVPHGEFMMAFLPNGTYQVQELARFVTATAFQNRLLLWAGYHRSYARTKIMAPEAIDRSLMVVLTTDGEFLVSAASPNQGLRVMLCGRRPPVFADFFDNRFFIQVPIREKRYMLRIRSELVALNK